MKKKILVCTLSLLLTFTSITSSFANPIILGKVAEVSIIYSLGRIAMDLVGVVGGVADIIQLGGSIFDKMNDKEKEDFKNNVNYNNDGFTYNKDNVENLIKDYLPSKGYHFLKPFKLRYDTHYYHDTDNNTSNIKEIFEQHKKSYVYQGINFDILTYTYPYSSSQLNYRTYIRVEGGSLRYTSHRSSKDINIFLDVYVDSILSNSTCTINYDYYYGDYKSTSQLVQTKDSCSNCPHDDITLKDKYDYPTLEEQKYIEENFPKYENDIPLLSKPEDDSNNSNGGNNGGDNGNNGGDNGNNGGNNSIITSPPQFPNLQEFNFNGLELEPLTNLFVNFKTKFPFSLPFDLSNLIGSLKAEPIPPKFETEIFNYNFVLDFTQFEVLAQLIRGFALLSYVVSLIFITKSFGG